MAVTLYTLQQLHDDTDGVIHEICESRNPAVLTRHGRFLAVVYPLPDDIIGEAIKGYLEDLRR